MDTSFSSTSEIKNLFSLLCITEELLFSIPLHSDLVEKYMVLRESGLKKIGLSANNSNLWDLQKQAHQELNQKHSSQEKQIKELSENLDSCRHSYKELYDISSKMHDFLKEIASDLLNYLNKPNLLRNHKETFHISLLSNHSNMNKSLLSDFNTIKDDIKANNE